MKKAAKGIIALTAVLAVLGGGLAALKLTEPKESGESSSSAAETSGTGVILFAEEAISSVDVKSQEAELNVFTLTPANGDAAAVYSLKGYEDLPMDTSKIGTIANNIMGLEASSVVAENCTDTAKYGFAAPRATASVTFESGETKELVIGDETPASSAKTYVMITGDDTVYTIDTSRIANYLLEPKDFVSSTILAEPPEEEYPVVKSLRIEREDIDYDILLKYDERNDDENYTGGVSAVHIMAEPTTAYLSVERSEKITNGMFGLSSSDIFAVRPDESQLAEAGLDKPFCTATMTCDDGNEYVLKLSEAFDDENNVKRHYAMLDGTDIIYIVSAENAQWGTVLPGDIASRIMFGTFVWNIGELKTSGKDLTENTFKITRTTEPSADNATPTGDDFAVTLNGKEFDTERYRSFYGLLTAANGEEFALGEKIPDGEPIVKITYHDNYSDEDNEVAFYDYTMLQSLVVINGESKFTCKKSYAENLAENTRRFETGEDYLTDSK